MQTNNKLREALSEISNLADALDIDNPNVVAILDQCRDALAEPERNCDVGTAEEQAERFAEYCDSEACKRNRCKSRAKALCIERCAIAQGWLVAHGFERKKVSFDKEESPNL